VLKLQSYDLNERRGEAGTVYCSRRWSGDEIPCGGARVCVLVLTREKGGVVNGK
jgi:hypothetical protein